MHSVRFKQEGVYELSLVHNKSSPNLAVLDNQRPFSEGQESGGGLAGSFQRQVSLEVVWVLAGWRTLEDLSASGWGVLAFSSSRRGPPLTVSSRRLRGEGEAPCVLGPGSVVEGTAHGGGGGPFGRLAAAGTDLRAWTQPYEHLQARGQWS